MAFDEAWEDGVLAWSSSAVEEALRSFVKCSQMRPKDTERLVNLAMALERVGEVDRAKDVLKRATTLDPNRAEPLIDLAAISNGAERISYLSKATEADPKDQITKYELANELTAAERYREALPLWEQLNEGEHGLSATRRERLRKSIALCRPALVVNASETI